MGRKPCCSEEDLNRGAWTEEEDRILVDYVKSNGEGRWRSLPKKAGLKRCGKSCRLRWLNYLRPDIKRGNITLEEEDLIIRLHKLLGNRWSLIAGRLPGRTDNEIKNYWNTYLRKKFQNQLETEEVVRLPANSLHQNADLHAGRETINDLPKKADDWWDFSEGWLGVGSDGDVSTVVAQSGLTSSLNYLNAVQEGYDEVLELDSSYGWHRGGELFESDLEWPLDDGISNLWEW